MITEESELKRFMKPSTGGSFTTGIKSVMDTSGNVKYTMIYQHRFTKNEAIDSSLAESFLESNKDKIVKVALNKMSTDLHILLK